MSIQRIYLPHLKGDDSPEELGQEDYHYIKNVLRLKPGDSLLLFDGKGRESRAAIRAFEKKSIILDITATEQVIDSSPPIILAQALPKENKMDYIVQKSTELGVSSIIPFTSSRTIPKLSPEKVAARVNRWQKIAVEAAKQCGSGKVPPVGDIMSFGHMLDAAPPEAIKIFFWEEESERSLEDILRGHEQLERNPVFIVIGPEGGFARTEADHARNLGFLTAHLGRRILRVETASLMVLSIIQYERGSMRLPQQEKGG